MTAKKYEFDAVILSHPKLNAGYIEFPYDVKKEFNKGRVKVIAQIDRFLYRGSLVKMGGVCHWLGITQEVRKAIGKDRGETVHVIMMEDTEERTIEVPEDFLSEIAKEPAVLEYFNRLSYTHRKEYVKWIVEAKKEETRKSRIEKAIKMLINRKTPL